MLEILRNMIKEEWRIHSSLFGGFMFALFPVLLASIAFAGSMVLPIIKTVIPTNQMLSIFQYLFILFGLSVGSFGLFGREIMNRRFGHASLLAYSSRSLPVSEKRIFVNFIVKDIIYYFILWIVPFILGFALASPFLSISLIYSFSFLLILTLSFLMGLSIAFFLSTVYAHSIKLLISFLVLLTFISFVSVYYSNVNISNLLSALSFYFLPSFNQIALSLLIITVPTAISLIFLKVDYSQRMRTFNNSLDKFSQLLRFSKYSIFVSKDFLDFNRSEGGLGKIIFSFFLPLAFVWLLISIFVRFIPILNPFVVFSIFLGILSSSFYNWFTEFDLFTSYAFLPVRISTLIKSKINSYMIINLIPLFVLIFASLWANQIEYFIPSLFVFLAVSSYTLSITTYLAGLNPNILLYNAKVFLEYLLLISPVLLVLIFLSIVPVYLILSIILIPISYSIAKKSYDKWDRTEQPYF